MMSGAVGLACFGLWNGVELPVAGAVLSPEVEWQYSFGGASNEVLFSLIPVTGGNGHHLLGGYSYSGTNTMKSSINHGAADYWLQKVDAMGVGLWDRSYGGASDDLLISTVNLSGGGFLLGGTSLSGVSGNKTAPSLGLRDYWVLRIDSDGGVVWDKSYGGTGSDFMQSVVEAKGGTPGYWLGGYSFSETNGTKTSQGHGLADYWIVRTDEQGNPLLDRALGGPHHDYLIELLATDDGGVLLGGYSYSELGGSKTSPAIGGADYWLIRLDVNGDLVWQKSYGGAGTDELQAMFPLAIGDFLLGGYSNSRISGTKTQSSYGGTDYWVLRIDGEGQEIWQRTLGGVNEDQLWTVRAMDNGQVILGGWSNSPVGGTKTSESYGQSDYWIVGLNSMGEFLWDASYGGSADEVTLGLSPSTSGSLLLGGYSFSGVEGNKSATNMGEGDYWLMKLNLPSTLNTGEIRLRTVGRSVNPGEDPEFIFIVSGPVDRNYVLEYSIDLVNWNPFQTNLLAEPEMEIRDPVQSETSGRFYRAKLVE
jgi:hypothetical protein